MLPHDMMLNMLYARETTEHRRLDLWSEMRKVHKGSLSQKEGQQSAAIRVIQQLYLNPVQISPSVLDIKINLNENTQKNLVVFLL